MIESVELKNWKTHKETKISFQKGVNVLIGIMGAGKSSVMDSISFALFGTFPALQHKRVSLKGLVTNRPFQENDAEVALNFTVGVDTYRVVRKVSSKGSTTSRLEKNGEYLQTQTERVSEEIESILKVDYDTFSRAVYAEQNMMDYFLELPKGERKRQIDLMLGLDNFSRAEENATSLINTMRSLIKGDEEALAQMDIKAQKDQLVRLTDEINRLNQENEKLAAEAEAKSAGVSILKSEFSRMKTLEERKNTLATKAAASEGKLFAISAEAKKIAAELSGVQLNQVAGAFELAKSALAASEKEIKLLKADESSAMKALSEADAEIRHGERRIAELGRTEKAGKAPDAILAEIKALEEELDSHRRSRAKLISAEEEAKKALAELESHISKCPICERDLDERTIADLKEKKRKSIEASHALAENDAKSIKVTETKIKVQKSEHERAVLAENAEKESKKLQELIEQEKVEKAKKELAHRKAAESLESAHAKMEEARKARDALSAVQEKAKRLEGYTTDIKELEAEITRIRAESLAIMVSKAQVQAANDALIAESNRLAQAQSTLLSNRKYLIEISRQQDDTIKVIAKTEALAAGIEQRRSKLSSMNKFKAALVETEAALRYRLVDSINSMMQDVWVRIYPYGDYQGVRLLSGKDDYVMEVATGTYADGKLEWADLNGVASGGERSMACLAMRIAMSMVIVPNLRWLILDEPTHNIDENGISKLVGVLGDTLPNVVEQVFIITHDTSLKNIAGARIYQFERNKSKNEHTSYTEL